MSALTSKTRYDFRGAGVPETTGTADSGPFKKKITGSGTVTKNSYGLELSLEATSEIQNVCVYNDDVLAYDIDEIVRVEFLARVDNTAGGSATSIYLGLASARNDAPDSITTGVWFKSDGAVDSGNALLVECDNGTDDVDDYDTGADWLIDSGWQRFAIDFTTGVKTQSPPFVSTGSKSNIFMYTETNATYGPSLRRVAEAQALSLAGITGGLQLFAQIQKTASTDVVALTIREICIEMKDKS